MLIICKIMILFNIGGVLIQSSESLEGKIISSSYSNYLADFSKDAKEKKYYGDYSKVLVSKDKCVIE